MRKYLVFLLALLIVPLASAVTPEFIFETNTTVNLPFTCKDNILGEPCNSAFTCNVHVEYPDGTILHNNTQASRQGNGLYNVTLTNLNQNGFYLYNGVCTNTSDSQNSNDLFFQVTQTGQDFNSAQGLASLGILGSIIAISFLFILLGFKFSKTPKMLPLTLLFVILAIILVFYALQLGFTYSHDILQYDNLSAMQTTVFNSILYLVVGVGVISFLLMFVSFFKEFGKQKMKNSFGDDFDPITQTYN